ncbi:hypothetical protein [Allokutzneria oryzae]|uniref:Tetratricopeptide repeat protein n=1 Tax=Allokutzneria oryzae TaxID=1378989 RepID=A0ABV6A738_9PSEU
MTARRMAVVLTAALAVYFVLLAGRGIDLIASGEVVGALLGVAILLLPVLGVILIVFEWRFGAQTERLARLLDDDGEFPDTSQLPRRPSGRVERDAADAYFAERKQELDAAPEDWRAWFKVAQAYDLAGDRKRGRESMRKAIELEQASR